MDERHMLEGAWSGWQWDLAGTLDLHRRTGLTEKAIDLTAAN